MYVCTFQVPATSAYVRFSNANAGLRAAVAPATNSVIRVPYTIFMVSRYYGTVAPTGILLHSQERVRQLVTSWHLSLSATRSSL